MLLLVFTYNFMGSYIAFHLQRYYIKKEIKTRIKQRVPENELSLISVTAANEHELEWEHSREFRYRGTMYDVVRKETPENGTVHYYCVTDQQETQLFVHLDELIKLAMAEKGKSGKPAKSMFKNIPVYLPTVQMPLLTSFTCEHVNTDFLSGYQSPVLENTSPPPRLG